MASFFRRYVMQNFGLKVFSLAMAVLLWAAITRDQVVEDAFNVPIEFHAIPENLEISSETIPQAQVRVRGPSRVLASLRRSDIHVDIDLTGAGQGERTFDLNAQRVVHVPRNVAISQVIPAQLHVSFDWRSTRTVPVRPRIAGSPAAGMVLRQVTANPAQITIAGPRQRVDVVQAAVTDPIDITGLTHQRVYTTNAYVPDPLVQVLHPADISVSVEVSSSRAAGD
jgi:YbbR domain-containing protein